MVDSLNPIGAEANSICKRLVENTQFAKNVIQQGELSKQYIRVRHEDFALNPIEITQHIYDFVGINMNPTIKKWLKEATSQQNDANLSVKQSQGTKRNAAKVISAWRSKLSWDKVQMVQKICSEPLDLLGYRRFDSKKDLKSIESIPHVMKTDAK
uniref:Sulfotransferase n=1 Tax=Phallusia mammillata TaxID=59560 RepID=A0A6F9D9Y5_9ASCI|nr:carbohydrate sulfotransferase 1-like [Phallusia mammillata]